MQREIKFRAWIGKKEMIYSDNTYGGYIDFFDKCKSYHDGFGGCYLMQFTGLYDKNGVEIYEGDIVVFEVSNYEKCLMFGYVEWWKEIFMFGIHRYKWINRQGEITRGKEIGQGGFPLHTISLSSVEVIGNLYEHPNLLEGIK